MGGAPLGVDAKSIGSDTTSPALPATVKDPFIPPGETIETWESYYCSLNNAEKHTIDLQDAFLAVFAVKGTILRAAPAAGVHRTTVYWWETHDLHRFRERMVLAHHHYRERLQDLGLGRIELQKPNDNPLLLITMYNAEWPEKYRRDTVVIGSDAVKELLGKLAAGMARDMEKEKQVIEGSGSHVLTPQEQVKQLTAPGKQNDAPK